MQIISKSHEAVNPLAKNNFNSISSIESLRDQPEQCSYTNFHPQYGNLGDVHKKHKIMQSAIKRFNFGPVHERVIEELVNCSNGNGITEVSNSVLAKRCKISKRSVDNYLKCFVDLNIITREKRGWMQTCTTTLLAIRHELKHKDAIFAHKLNSINTDSKKTLDHYSEYECLLKNSEIKRPPDKVYSPQSGGYDSSTNKWMLAESKVSREALPDALQSEIYRAFDEHEHVELETVFKRLVASLDEKLELVKEIAHLSKQFVVKNLSGLAVARFKKMRTSRKEGVRSYVERTRSIEEKEAIWRNAQDRAAQAMSREGIEEPELVGGDIESYDAYHRYHAERDTRSHKIFKKMLESPTREPDICSYTDWVNESY